MIQSYRFKQARELRALTQIEIATALGVDQSLVSLIERGLSTPRPDYVSALALHLKLPSAFFHKPVLYQFPVGSLAYRKLARLSRTLEIQCHQYADVLFELAESLLARVNAPALRLPRLSEDPVTAARITRAQLGLSPDQPIQHLLLAVERAGVLAIALPIAGDGLDGFSTWAGGSRLLPVLVLGGTVSWERRRFTTAHELGHLVLHQSPQGSVAQFEHEANEFAAELLLPSEAMCHQFSGHIAMRDLAKLKQTWKVSFQTLVRRAFDLGLCTERQYRYFFEQLSALGWRRDEPGSHLMAIERPRAVRKMVEILYGNPINYEELADESRLPAAMLRELLDH